MWLNSQFDLLILSALLVDSRLQLVVLSHSAMASLLLSRERIIHQLTVVAVAGETIATEHRGVGVIFLSALNSIQGCGIDSTYSSAYMTSHISG
mmetsp:Transcript_16811/g.38696  ORF Transcript_16811/g.38696 Transcript_16811/m.38696 type:complete len:94 (+) Transcript_16811:1694-1975(+)